MQNLYQQLISSIGEDVSRAGLVDTPKRAAKAFQYLTQGYQSSLEDIVNGAIFPSDNSEMVIVQDIEVPDMEARRGPKEDWGITEGKARRILNLTDGSEKPPGEWNTMVVETVENTVRVWVNGDLVNDGFNATVSEGQIALQAEGSEVEFRKVALTPISKLSNP